MFFFVVKIHPNVKWRVWWKPFNKKLGFCSFCFHNSTLVKSEMAPMPLDPSPPTLKAPLSCHHISWNNLLSLSLVYLHQASPFVTRNKCHCKAKMKKALLPYTLFPHNFLPPFHVKVNFVSYWIYGFSSFIDFLGGCSLNIQCYNIITYA